jgi:DNA polymerase II small subunit/DNA polymerase delta subunit B
MTRRVITLEKKAKANLDICCNSLCDSSIVEEYVKELEERVKELESLLREKEEKSDSLDKTST